MSKKVFSSSQNGIKLTMSNIIFKNNEEHHLCNKSKIISFMLNISKKKSISYGIN